MKGMKKGQTMVEYIIIVCLIAIALIGVFTFFGKQIHKKASGAGEALTGEKAGAYGEQSEEIKDIANGD